MFDLLLYLAIFFAPMGAKALSFSIGGVKMSLFRLLIILSIMLLAANCLRTHKGVKIARPNNRYSVKFIAIWFLYAVITVVWSRDISNWFRNLFFLLIGLCCIILFINHFDTDVKILKAFKALNFGIIIQSLIGWYEIITLDYRFIEMTGRIEDLYLHGKLRTPIAMAGNQNDFATMMVFGAFIGYLCAIITPKKIWKAIYAIFAASEVALLLLSTSRANILGFLLAVMFILLVGGHKKIIIIIFAFSIVTIWPEILSNLSSQLYYGLVNTTSDSDIVRINLIRNGFLFVIDSFGLGVGCGQVESWMLNHAVYPTSGIINMHNWWMEILTGYGILIFLGYIVYYYKLAKDYILCWLRSANQVSRNISMAIASIMVSYVLAAISSSSNMTNEFLWVFWAICIAYQGLLPKVSKIDI